MIDLDELERKRKAAESDACDAFEKLRRYCEFDESLHEAAHKLIAMARRYQWLCADHEDAATREKCREIIERMSARSESANNAAIDAAMQEQEQEQER